MKAFIVTDLGYGDSGKGATVASLAHAYPDTHLVVRHEGGAQAAHHVVDRERAHTFAQFGAASFKPGVKTFLSRHMLVHPSALIREAQHLIALGETDILDRLTIDENAPLITPFQQAINRLREIDRGAGKHGSCGMGIGETRNDHRILGNDAVLASDLKDVDLLKKKLRFMRAWKMDQNKDLLERFARNPEPQKELHVFTDWQAHTRIAQAWIDMDIYRRVRASHHLHSLLHKDGTVIFEGSQGVLLDEKFGFHPYTTWSTVTGKHAHALLKAHDYQGKVTHLGLTRAYGTRHGAGPFPTEDANLTKLLPDTSNGYDRWQEGFRVGHFDAVTARYALEAVGTIDGLVVTCNDRLDDSPLNSWQAANEYQTGDMLIADLPLPKNREEQIAVSQMVQSAKPVYVSHQTKGRYIDTYPYHGHISDLLGKPWFATRYGAETKKIWINDRFNQKRSFP